MNAIRNIVDAMTPVHKALILIAAVSSFLIYSGYHLSLQREATLCSQEGYPGRCYHFDEEVCQIVWNKAENTCSEYIRTLDLQPGRLIGPFAFKCQLAKLDNAFEYSRKSTPECDKMFTDLKEWKTRNEIE